MSKAQSLLFLPEGIMRPSDGIAVPGMTGLDERYGMSSLRFSVMSPPSERIEKNISTSVGWRCLAILVR